MRQSIHSPAVLLLTQIYLMINSSAEIPMLRKCVLGDGLLNSLVGSSGVQQKDDYVAEENVFGWSSGPLDGIASTNLTQSELKDCLQEYDKASASAAGKPLPPGVTPEKDPSHQLYLPPASGKDVLINGNGEGNGHGEYYTTYDGSKYKFKEKGYVVDPPSSGSPSETPSSTQNPPSPATEPKPSPGAATSKPPSAAATTTKQPDKGSSQKKKDELQQWYKAFVSVVSKYM